MSLNYLPKRQRNSEKHSMFGHLLLKLGGGGIDIHAIWKGVSEQARVHGGGGGGGGEGRCPPLEIGKKDAVRGNFNLFHLCFTNDIRGESIHYTCKMEGWADRHASVQKSTAYTWLDCCCSTQHKLYSLLLPPAMGARFYRFFGQDGQADPLVGWRCCY